MTRKPPNKRLQDYQRQLEMLAKEEQKQRQAYKDFVGSIQELEPLEKAESWLRYVADNAERYSDQEAIVYLASRGYDCKKYAQKIVTTWRLAEKQAIERCMYGTSVYNLDTGKRSRRGGLSESNAKDILNRSPFELHDFWGGSDEEGLFIGATMLRTVEWCQIGGFEKWWQRYSREQLETTIQGGIRLIPASYYLFAMTSGLLP